MGAILSGERTAQDVGKMPSGICRMFRSHAQVIEKAKKVIL